MTYYAVNDGYDRRQLTECTEETVSLSLGECLL